MGYLIGLAAITLFVLGVVTKVDSAIEAHDKVIRDAATTSERAKWEPALKAYADNEATLKSANKTLADDFDKFKKDTDGQRKAVDGLHTESTTEQEATRRLARSQADKIAQLQREKADLLARRKGPAADAGKSCEQKLSATEQLLMEARDERIKWTLSLPTAVPVPAGTASVMKVR